MKKINWTNYIGYILFAATLITWGFTAGKSAGRLDNIEETVLENKAKLEKIQESQLEQNQLNGRIIQYIETEINNNKDNE